MVTKTITSIFMLPTIGIPKNNLIQNNFINAYAIDSNLDVQYQDAIYVIFKPTCLDTFKVFLEEEYNRTTDIVADYDYIDGLVVLVYKLNLLYTKDFNLIKKGKYSQTSKTFQSLFSQDIITGDGITKKSLQFRIFNKAPSLRDYLEEVTGNTLDEAQELWEMYEVEKETLKL